MIETNANAIERFSLRDAFALTVGGALAATFLRIGSAPSKSDSFIDRQYQFWPIGIGPIEFAFCTLVLGFILSGPFVILFRWIGNWQLTRLSLGEILWLLPMMSWIVLLIASRFQSHFSDRSVDVSLGHWAVLNVAFAAYRTATRVFYPERFQAVRWSDSAGGISFVLLIALIFYAGFRLVTG